MEKSIHIFDMDDTLIFSLPFSNFLDIKENRNIDRADWLYYVEGVVRKTYPEVKFLTHLIVKK